MSNNSREGKLNGSSILSDAFSIYLSTKLKDINFIYLSQKLLWTLNEHWHGLLCACVYVLVGYSLVVSNGSRMLQLGISSNEKEKCEKLKRARKKKFVRNAFECYRKREKHTKRKMKRKVIIK